jgi:hypothetical protein
MKRRSLLLILIAANLCIFVLAWILIPSHPNDGNWFTPLVNAFSADISYWYVPWVVLVVTILGSIAIWNYTFPNDGTGEQ